MREFGKVGMRSSGASAMGRRVLDRRASCREQQGPGSRRDGRSAGFTLIELLIVLVIVGMLAAGSITGYYRWRESVALAAAERGAHGQLALARTRALARREYLRVRLATGGVLETVDQDGVVVDRTRLLDSPLGVDSARLRPSTMRFNARGQAAPGSLYLYRGRRVVRIVCNFLGRLRVERYEAS